MKFLLRVAGVIAALANRESNATAILSSADSWKAVDVLYPRTTSLFYASTGDIKYNSSHGLIYKGIGSMADSDVTTLVTFAVPEGWAGKKCRLDFDLESDDVLSGSKTVDVFTSLTIVEHSSSGWSPGNQRDQYLGRFMIDGSRSGKWIDTDDEVPRFDCPADEVVTWELVGVNDRVEIRWTSESGKGPRMAVA